MIRKDCFGCVPGRKDCQVMTENICEKRNCTFFKTKEDFLNGIQSYKGAVRPDACPAGKASRGKMVKCVDTGEIFRSAAAAAYKIGARGDEVSRVCRGEAKQIRGYRFVYVEEEV